MTSVLCSSCRKNRPVFGMKCPECFDRELPAGERVTRGKAATIPADSGRRRKEKK